MITFEPQRILNMSGQRKLFLFLTVSLFLLASCSTPAYKQNKYKRAKRYNDCGCMNYDTNSNRGFEYYAQK
jgi:hypothetical protein